MAIGSKNIWPYRTLQGTTFASLFKGYCGARLEAGLGPRRCAVLGILMYIEYIAVPDAARLVSGHPRYAFKQTQNNAQFHHAIKILKTTYLAHPPMLP